jgi:hypothetical protein
VIADADGQVNESNETNNISTPVEIVVTPETATPIVTVQNVSVGANTAIPVSFLISSISPSSDIISQYSVYDAGGDGGHFTVNGVVQPDGQWINIPASNWAITTYVGGPSAGTENLSVEVYDSTASLESSISTLTATTTTVTAATVTSVVASPSTGDVATGGSVTLTVTMSKSVTVAGGVPTLSLNDGGTASYDAAKSSTTALVFDYTVQSGQSVPALAVTGLSQNGATIQSVVGNSANFSGIPTTFSSLQVNQTQTVPVITISGATAGQTTTDTASISPFNTPFSENGVGPVTISDSASGETIYAGVAVSLPANGTLSNLSGGTYDPSSGNYIVSGTAAAVTAAIDGLVFTPTPHQAPAGQTVTTSFGIVARDASGVTAEDLNTSVVTTETSQAASPNLPAVTAAYEAILRSAPPSTLANQTASEIDAGQATLASFDASLIASEQTLYTTLPALVTIDAYYGATPQSSTLTTVAAATGSPSQIGGFYSAAYLHGLGYSDANVWTIMASQWGADKTSAFYELYNEFGSNYSSFISTVYQREFGSVPSEANLQNLVNDVAGVQSLLAGGDGAPTPIQVVSGIYGYLLYVGQTTPSLASQYATSADAFLQAAGNGTVVYGTELTTQFPPNSSAVTHSAAMSSAQLAGGNQTDAAIITISGPDQLIDPGTGNHTIQFITGSGADTLVVHRGGVDQISGFDPTTGVLDLRSLLSGTGVNLTDYGSALNNYLTVVDQGTDAHLLFDPTGLGGGSTVAVLKGLSVSVTGLQTLIADGAIKVS